MTEVLLPSIHNDDCSGADDPTIVFIADAAAPCSPILMTAAAGPGPKRLTSRGISGHWG
jgi:hypothetical protein